MRRRDVVFITGQTGNKLRRRGAAEGPIAPRVTVGIVSSGTVAGAERLALV